MVERDLAQCMTRIQHTLSAQGLPASPSRKCLRQVAEELQAFVAGHASLFDFSGFPLPAPEAGVLNSYTLFQARANGLCLHVNAMAGGVDSAVHDHGTWALIVGIHGTELNRIYRRAADSSEPAKAGLVALAERRVGPGQWLHIAPEQFHSVHTPARQAALQLHLYGRNPDSAPVRHAVDMASGQWASLTPTVT